jgi:polar amino acid transport system permease protein
MSFDLGIFAPYSKQLLSGFRMTLFLWVAGGLLAMAIGFVVAMLQVAGGRVIGAVIRAYIELMRGTPLLTQLFLLYFGGPAIGLTLDAMTVGLAILGLYVGAYFAETFRAGFESIPRGQIEAAASAGIGRWQRLRHIILPQMLVLILPPVVNLWIVVLKDTAVLSIITIPELTFEVTGLTLETFAFVEPFLLLAVVYWGLVELTAYLGRTAERRLGFYLAR